MANILLCSVCILVGALRREVNIDQGEIQKSVIPGELCDY